MIAGDHFFRRPHPATPSERAHRGIPLFRDIARAYIDRFDIDIDFPNAFLPDIMNIILTAVDEPLAYAWERFCGDLDIVRIHRGSILDLKCDAIVSPANSYGFMDGGIDAIYTDYFGPGLGRRVRERIRDHHHGELVVGTADIVETDDEKIPYMVIAPTMRVPMVLEYSVNPYLAARATFLLIKHGRFESGPRRGEAMADVVNTIAFPGLGTGVGGMGANTCAHQVRRAIDDIVLEQYRMPDSFADASIRHQLLYRDVPTRMQNRAPGE